MKKIIINELEKVTSEDLNAIGLIPLQLVQEVLFKEMLGGESGFVNNSFEPTIISATSVQVGRGLAFINDVFGVGGYHPNFRAMWSGGNTTFNLTSQLPAAGLFKNCEIYVRPEYLVTNTATRMRKNQITNQVEEETVQKLAEDKTRIEISYTAAAASPGNPTVPSNALTIATFKIGSTGILTGQFFDQRNMVTKKTTTALTAGTHYLPRSRKFYFCDCSGGNITVNLPDPMTFQGVELEFKKTDSSANTIIFNTTIEGEVNPVIDYQYTGRAIIAHNGAWYWSK